MKIGLLSFEYPPETGFGGIGTYTWYQARALVRLGHEVHVLAGAKEAAPLTSRVSDDGVHVHRFRPSGKAMRAFDAIGNRWQCWWTRQRLENSWAMYHGVKALHRQYKFDILEMPECGAEGFLVNPLLGLPTVVRFHSPSRLIMPFYDVRKADTTLCSWLEQRAIQSATALSSCSGFLAGEVRSKLGIRKPVEVIPNGIDLNLFDQEQTTDIREKYGIPKGKRIIFFAGRMERRKGIHLCGEIASAILRKYDAAFVFAGQDLFGYMEKTLLPSVRSQDLKGSIHYIGKLDLPELRFLSRTCDIFILPSIWENCPYSCLEAMAAGRAIVSSDQGGMPELIEDGKNGVLCKSGEAGSYIDKIGLLLDNPDRIAALGEAARRTVEARLTDRAVAVRTADYFQKVAASGRT
jgi:glycogen synthase